MNDAGRQQITKMIFEGYTREQILDEMIFRGYKLQDVKMELDMEDPETETPPVRAGPEKISGNEAPSAFQNLDIKENKQPSRTLPSKYILALAAILLILFAFYVFFPDNMGSGEPLLSEAELDVLWASCQAVQAEYQMSVPSDSSVFYENEDLLYTLNALKKETENCYANYSVMSGDYSYCDKMPQYENNIMNLDGAKCYLTISSLNGDEKVCDKLSDFDKKENTVYEYACYAGIARYSGDASYCDKIPLEDGSAANKVNCVLDMANEENYDHLCVSLLPCTNCRVSTFIAVNFASCFANVAYETGNTEICSEALGFDDLCYGQLATYKKDISLCEKAGRIKDECRASLSAINENTTVRLGVNVS